MSLESFYHEVALRQASADRDNLNPALSRWRRCLAKIPPAAKRLLAITTVAALAIAGWWLRAPTGQYLLGSSPHSSDAADVLVAVTHHASPVGRARRLVLACARENNAHTCQESLRQALTFAPPDVVASWLKEKEVHALRVNAYFEQFAAKLETHPEQLHQPSATPTHAVVPSSQPQTPKTRATQTKGSPGDLPANLPARLDGSGFNTPNRSASRLLGAGASMQKGATPSPHTFLDVSRARSINPNDAVNEHPVKVNSLDALFR